MKKYKLHIEAERDGSTLTIDDIVDKLPNLEDYIYTKDLEVYNIIKFEFKPVEEGEKCQ